MSSDDSNDTDREQQQPHMAKRRKKSYQYKFCASWLKVPEFKFWLTESKKGSTFYHCKVCKEDHTGGISAVRKHFNSKKTYTKYEIGNECSAN